MKLIDRFVGRELIVNVLFAIAVLSLVLVVGNIFRKLLPLLVNHDVPLQYLLTFIAYVLPFSLIFTIPWGLLTAILLVFGRLSADNELIALRANGVSVTRICVPLAGLALVCTVICLWLNVDVAPAAQEKLRSSIFDLATSNPIALFGGDQVIDQFPGRKIYVGKKEGNKLENIIVFQMDEHSLPVRVTHARTGMLEADWRTSACCFISITLAMKSATRRTLTICAGFAMASAWRKERCRSVSRSSTRRKRSGRPGLRCRFRNCWSSLKSGKRKDRSATRTEINKRFSFPFSCLAFALIGVPLGITTHRRETSVGFATGLHRGHLLFPLHHHRRHDAREREDPSGAAGLVPERALSRSSGASCSGA